LNFNGPETGIGIVQLPNKYGMETENNPNENNEVANYDYSDAPEWAVPREWFVTGRYDLEYDTSEFTEPL